MIRVLVLVFAALLLVTSTPPITNAAAENVSVMSAYLTDSEGWNYGARYWLDSTVSDVVCVAPIWVQSWSNVVGSVVPLATLQPNERGFSIGQFIAAQNKKAWSVDVRAKWKRGTC